jgi:hypothetical protein
MKGRHDPQWQELLVAALQVTLGREREPLAACPRHHVDRLRAAIAALEPTDQLTHWPKAGHDLLRAAAARVTPPIMAIPIEALTNALNCDWPRLAAAAPTSWQQRRDIGDADEDAA